MFCYVCVCEYYFIIIFTLERYEYLHRTGGVATESYYVQVLPWNTPGILLYPNSVQEYLIDIHSADDKKTLKMTIRSDSGVRPEKGTSGQGRLGQYLQLKMQYSGIQ